MSFIMPGFDAPPVLASDDDIFLDMGNPIFVMNASFSCDVYHISGALSPADHMYVINHSLNKNIIPIGGRMIVRTHLSPIAFPRKWPLTIPYPITLIAFIYQDHGEWMRTVVGISHRPTWRTDLRDMSDSDFPWREAIWKYGEFPKALRDCHDSLSALG